MQRIKAPQLLGWMGLGMMLLLSGGCSEEPAQAETTPPDKAPRWYSEAQVAQGQEIFATHCASCHGAQAEGTPYWRRADENGNFPPPPLNGSAHAWHHPLSVLLRTIDRGGIPLGGTMPGFQELLTDGQKHAAIAYFQSFWSDEVYQRWLARDGLK